jgi:hypothetical protein
VPTFDTGAYGFNGRRADAHGALTRIVLRTPISLPAKSRLSPTSPLDHRCYQPQITSLPYQFHD